MMVAPFSFADQGIKQAVIFHGGQGQMRRIRLRRDEAVVEYFLDCRPGLSRMLAKNPDVKHLGVTSAPQSTRPAKRRNAAFHGDAGSGERRDAAPLQDDACGALIPRFLF